MTTVLTALLFVAVPAITIVIGSVMATFFTPSSLIKSAVQHFAAGVVFYAVAVELLPDVINKNQPLSIIVGFAVGVFLLITIRKYSNSTPKESKVKGQSAGSLSMLAAVGIDVTLDGLLVGLGFAVGGKQGIILAIAMGVEDGFLGLSIALQLQEAQRSRLETAGVSVVLVLLTLVGGFVGVTLLDNLPGNLLEGVLSFGVAALLYLVTEELLVEAHEERETSLTTSMFFTGFLAFLILGLLT